MRAITMGGALAATAVGAATTYVGVEWARYGHVEPDRHPVDPLLDRFVPDPEVDEYHALRVEAPASITYAAAKQMDLQSSAFVKGIFFLRAIPSLVKGQPFRPGSSRGIVDETLAQGWGILAEEPDRQIVIGAYAQPWHENVEFRALPPADFASFDEPGFVKIVWTLAAEPLDARTSRFVTRTRVVTTDDGARRRFRRYWAPMSSGIVLIRYLALPMVKHAAERTARAEGVGVSLPPG
jgi:hypothetical protein